jgi:hypothetical protein
MGITKLQNGSINFLSCGGQLKSFLADALSLSSLTGNDNHH